MKVYRIIYTVAYGTASGEYWVEAKNESDARWKFHREVFVDSMDRGDPAYIESIEEQ